MTVAGVEGRAAVAADRVAGARNTRGGIPSLSRGGLAAAWHLPLLAGVLPLLAGGFWISGVANRLSFAAWGLLSALLWFVVVRVGLLRGWNRGGRAGALLLVAATALAALAPLLAREGASLGSGLRAVAPALVPAAPGPVSTAVAAALCALAGFGLLAAARARADRPEASP